MKQFLIVLLTSLIASTAVPVKGEILIVDSGRNRVMLASSFDGSILNASYITDAAWQTPVNAIDSGRGTVFVSDQVLNEVREYAYGGGLIGTVVASSQVNNIRGIDVRDNALYVTVAGGTNAGTVQRFDLTSGTQSTFIAASLNLASPWDVTFRANDVLVSDSTVDRIQRFDLTGSFLGSFSPLAISFPQQINIESDSDIVVGNNTGGIVRFTGAGGFIDAVGPTSARGVFLLGNGNYIFGSGINLGIYNPTTNTSTNLITDNQSSFRYIEAFTPVPEPTAFAMLTMGCGLVSLVRRRRLAE